MLMGAIFTDAMGRDTDARALPLLDARRRRAVREVVPDGHRRPVAKVEHAMRVHPSSRFVRRALIAFVAALLVARAPRRLRPAPLTLDDALKQAAEKSDAVDVARAGESRADADIQRADSQRLPQVNFAGSYDRTLASEFSGAFESIGHAVRAARGRSRRARWPIASPSSSAPPRAARSAPAAARLQQPAVRPAQRLPRRR